MNEHNMTGPCLYENSQLTTVFNTVLGEIEAVYSMSFYEELFIEVMERRYTIVPDFTDPSDPELFCYVNQGVNVANDTDLDIRRQFPFFQLVFQRLK